MIKVVSVVFLLFVIGNSCISTHKGEDKNRGDENLFNHQNLLSNQFIIDKDFYQLSFPNWFNSSVVEDNNILIVELLDYEIDSSRKDLSQLKRERIIRFNEKGKIDSLYTKSYYQNKLIEQIVYVYGSEKDSFGYSFPKIDQQRSTTSFEDEKTERTYLKTASILELVSDKINPGTLLFRAKNLNSNDQYLYILEKSKQNISFVDQWQEKNGTAIITYGSPTHPQKSFQVENLVNKSQQVSYTYDKSGEFLTQINLSSVYSNQKTRINYNENGYVSDFSQHITDRKGQTIEYKKFLIEYNDKVLPEELILMQGVDTANLHASDKLVIKYSFIAE